MKFDLDKILINEQAQDLTRVLVDSNMREVNDDADAWATYVADLAWSRHVSPVGFVIEPEEGMYMLLPNSLKELYPKLKHTYHFNLVDYIKTISNDFWLCVYDKDEHGKITQHTVKYTRKPVTQ